ncbi:hypothetical protein PAMA_018131 [Pampus argenteus]
MDELENPKRKWRPPRACDDYWTEFKHCKSLWHRFHHYYTFGTSPSCHQWKVDYNNCRKWEKHTSTDAKEALQQSERDRVAQQTNFTPVWQMREAPPSDWNLPLNQEKPDYKFDS